MCSSADDESGETEGGVHVEVSPIAAKSTTAIPTTTIPTTTAHTSMCTPRDLEKSISEKKSNQNYRGRAVFSTLDTAEVVGAHTTCGLRQIFLSKTCGRWIGWASIVLLVVVVCGGGLLTGVEVTLASVHPRAVSGGAGKTFDLNLNANQSDNLDPTSNNPDRSTNADHLHTPYINLKNPNLKFDPEASINANSKHNNIIPDPNPDPPSSPPFSTYQHVSALLIIKDTVRRFEFNCSNSRAHIRMVTAHTNMDRVVSSARMAMTDRAGVTLQQRAYEFCVVHIGSELEECVGTIVTVIYQRLHDVDI